MASSNLPGTVAGLTHWRWALPVLAALAGGVTARLPQLCVQLGASRGGLADALEALIAAGLVARVPPPRHPLQPEWQLTESGAAVAAAAADMAQLARRLDVEPALRRRWAVPVIAALSAPQRYNALRRSLPGVTDRSLALTLAALAEAALIARTIDAEARPPASHYCLSATGAALLPAVRRLLGNPVLGKSSPDGYVGAVTRGR